MRLPCPLIESIDLTRREVARLNHIAASPVARHRLADPKCIRNGYELDGGGTFVHPDSAKAFG